ncbi:PaaX family transcriptional regulator C-terminal domain-containing protein [uncultured Jannaschia sp.]|uniref:PaaX family transcriptional regulator C-terminal domain-containing protein n=1 Tax=uncultured Jannaschia sp. TaxID=293347 RepID=UPI002622651D|nr:PaaX family transcriptional regulator C-terminal domain-containing protein [uncultured Jannaschia sp.]
MSDLDRIVQILTAGQSPRVWSVLVTVFGDLAPTSGDRISGALLRRIGAEIGFRPEAVRVALHRLRKEGWIESHRSGRTTDYDLTARGAAETRSAAPSIYRPVVPDAGYLVLDEAGAALDTLWVTPQMGLSARPVGHALRLDRPPPEWMRRATVSPDLMAETARVAQAFASLARQPLPPLDPLGIAVVRVLIVHDWRRIALRATGLPDAFHPDGWAGAGARDDAKTLLDRLPRPYLSELEAAVQANAI